MHKNRVDLQNGEVWGSLVKKSEHNHTTLLPFPSAEVLRNLSGTPRLDGVLEPVSEPNNLREQT